MLLKSRNIWAICLLGALVCSCQNGPKVTEVSTDSAGQGKSTFPVVPEMQAKTGGSFADELHKVVVEEVKPATRYVFLKVREGSVSRWIATRLMDVTKGGTYYYRGGLLKTNFESKEFNRNFDTIYLVSNLVGADHSRQGNSLPALNLPSKDPLKSDAATSETREPAPHQGIISIADLVKDPKRYEGHTIQLHGTCVKINPNIMKRNWIHLRDGSRDDFDLVITSDHYVPEGTELTMSGTVTLKKDFGAGYYYDLIVENGVLVR